MSSVQTLLVTDDIAYSGAQLRSHWAYETFDLLGDSVVAFVGPCDVAAEFMKDVEDLKAASLIRSERMLHFIAEHFDADLERAVWRQRALMALMAESLNRRIGRPAVARRGSDLYDGPAKLTVSIASASPVSALIHAGINISSRNTPVLTSGLEDYGIPAADFAAEMLQAYTAECAAAHRARCKVRACR